MSNRPWLDWRGICQCVLACWLYAAGVVLFTDGLGCK